MPLFDYPLDKLRAYRPERLEADDFDGFWSATLAEVRQHPLDAQFVEVDAGLVTVRSYDVAFSGFNGERVRGWFTVPAHASGPLPCVVEYIGYGGGRGLAHQHLLFASAGYAHLVMDSRGQAGADTGDAHDAPAGPHVQGFMTDGITDPRTYYYRRIVSDAVRAVEAARAHPDVDAARIVVAGGSQGGGLAIAAAGLVPDVLGAMPDVPFLCHYRRATEITENDPYGEIARFCARRPLLTDTVFTTLSYFDGVNLATRARSAALFSVALMDPVCPPSTVYAAYSHWGGQKEITVWPYNGHEGGGQYQAAERLQFLRRLLG